MVENDTVKILWDFMIQCDRYIEHRRPDIVVMEKNTDKCMIIDVACPDDHGLNAKRNEKLTNYSELRIEIARMWNKRTTIILIIIGALGSIPPSLHGYLDQIVLKHDINTMQQSVILGTANIIRKFWQ